METVQAKPKPILVTSIPGPDEKTFVGFTKKDQPIVSKVFNGKDEAIMVRIKCGITGQTTDWFPKMKDAQAEVMNIRRQHFLQQHENKMKTWQVENTLIQQRNMEAEHTFMTKVNAKIQALIAEKQVK